MKNFDKWNDIKKSVHHKQQIANFKEREIFWVSIGENIGYEQSGTKDSIDFIRPVLVFRKFNNNVFWGIPLTTSAKENKFHFKFQYLQDKDSYGIISQLRLFDAKRLERKSGMIKEVDFAKLREKIKILLEL